MSKLASRKFIISLITVLAATALLYLDKLAAANWETVVLGVVGLYAAANVTQAIGLRDK